MNHIHRVIWNAVSATWTAVAETVRGHGKSSKAVARCGGAVASGVLALIPPCALAQVVSVVIAPGSNLNAYVAPNGVTVVNINAANATGLSHNRYQSFNVNPDGLILNNTTSAQIVYQSQLAGRITSNFNQTNAARAILNEVVSNNRSTLAGFTEVLGDKADVVLANPYGVTCSGCGFINTDRVTLTTGNPFFAVSGALGGFSVRQGDILVTGTGLNATAQQVLDLVTRSVRAEAPVNARDVSIATGVNRWSYDTRAVTGRAIPTDDAPVHAIDTAALGGMYGNRIRMTSTEAGVGVRMLGNAAASAGDFTLTAAGRIELRNRISATTDVNVSTTGTDGNALALADTSLTSSGKTTLTVAGGISMSGSALVAGTDLAVSATSLLDSASASGIANNNLRRAGGALTLAVGNAASLGATQWGAAGAWNGNFGNLVTTGATKLYSSGGTLIASADRGDLVLGLALLQSAGTMELSAAGKISTMAGAGVQTLGGNLQLTAGNGISNVGTMTSDKGALTVRADGDIDNSGQIHAARNLDIAERSGGAGTTLSNSGTLLTDQALTLQAAKVTNTATARMQAQTGSVVNAASIDNQGAWLLSQQAGASDKLSVSGVFVNSGTLQGAGAVALDAGDVANSGTLIATTDLRTSTTGDIVNSGTAQAGGLLGMASSSALANTGSGVLQAARLDLKAGKGLSNAGIATADSGNATLRVDGTLDNSGQLRALGNIDIADVGGTATQAVVNSGKLLAQQSLALKAASFSNGASGWTQASKGSTATLGSLDNAGTWLLSQQADAKDRIDVTGALTQSGTLQSAGDLGMTSARLINSSTVLAAGKLDATTTGDLGNVAGGALQAGRTLTLTSGGAIDNAASATMAGQSVTLDADQGLANGGAIQASVGAATLRVNGVLHNSATVRAAGNIDIADRNGAATQTVTNSGMLLADQALVLKAAGMTNTATGSVRSGADSTIQVTHTLTNDGLLFSGHDLTMSASSITNGLTGGIASLHDLSVTATTGDLTNQGALYAGNALQARAESGTLRNTASLTARQGSISADKFVELSAKTLINNSAIDSGGAITVTTDSLRNEVPGGDSRVYGNASNSVTTLTDHLGQGYHGCACVDQAEYWYYSQTWYKDQTYANGAPKVKPQITGVGAVKLNFNSGKNLGGMISGDTVTLTGMGTGATFVNDDLALQRTSSERTWTEHTKYIAAGLLTYYNRYVEDDTTTHRATELSNIGAGVFARQLNGSNFALTNNGSTAQPQDMSKGPAKSVAVKLPDTLDVTKGTVVTPVTTRDGRSAIPFTAINAANGINGSAFGGIDIPLPANPNGLYVLAPEPDAKYLVETNPLYRIDSPTVGSDYLIKRLGYDADTLVRRLGDASYEAYLIKQQLIAQTGQALLADVRNAGAQVQDLMDAAAGESQALGLVYGLALTSEQQSRLMHDIVWMVQTEIDGHVVLAPVVYLSQQTRANITRGAVITATTAHLSLSSLTNTGGSIAGKETLDVVSVGDVSNTSGAIKGGNVAVESTQGSIVNQTAANGSGGELRYVTDIGKTASIESTGTLSLDAAKNISNTGADMAAGGNAHMKAGGSVSFDTIQDKRIDTTRGVFEQDGGTGMTTTTTTAITQMKSGLSVGGSLAMDAGKDIVLAGTDTKMAGNADFKAHGKLEIIARENSTTSRAESRASGVGMNSSLYGSTTVTTRSTSIRNVGSTLQVGGNASFTANNDITVQGSDVAVQGQGTVSASNLNVLAGRNYDATHTVVERTGVLQVSTSAGTSADAKSALDASAGSAPASVSPEVNANASGSARLALLGQSRTQTETTDLRHVGSNVKFGGHLTVNASQDVNLKGSTVQVGGDAKVAAQNVNLLAAEDKKTSQTQTESLSIGLMASSTNTVHARGNAEASVGAARNTNRNVKVGVSGQISASSENRLDILQHSSNTTSTLATTHRGSAIEAGGNFGMKAEQNLRLEGSRLDAGRDVDLAANKMEYRAVHDVDETRSGSSTTTAGLYVSGNASAQANAGAGVGLGVQASATAQAQARGEYGIYAANTRTESVEGSTTAVISGISAGRNLIRTARESITDVGTRIEAGGDLTQSTKTITSLAAANTTYSASSKTTDTAKLGFYAEVTASASAGLTVAEKGASVAAGVTTSYKHEDTASQAHASQAMVSSITVGGNVRSMSTNKTEMQGTTIDAHKDVNLKAESLDYRAAHNTSTYSEKGTNAGGTVDLNIAGRSVNLSASYQGSEQGGSRSEAVVGAIKAAGNLSVHTTGDARYEGSTLAAGGAVDLAAGGKTVFDAATNRQESRTRSIGVDAGVSVGMQGSGGNLGVQVQVAQSRREQEVGGSVRSASGPISIRGAGDASFTGITLDAGKNDVTIATEGELIFKATHDRQENLSVSVSAGISGAKGKSQGTGKFAGISKNYSETGAPNAALNLESSSSDTVTGTRIHSTGRVVLTAGKNAHLENIQVAGTGDVHTTAGGTLVQSTVQSTSDGFGVVAFAPEIRIPNTGMKGIGAKPSASTSGNLPRFSKGTNRDSMFEDRPAHRTAQAIAESPASGHDLPAARHGAAPDKTVAQADVRPRTEPDPGRTADGSTDLLPAQTSPTVIFKAPIQLDDGRVGYLLGPVKPTGGKEIGTRGEASTSSGANQPAAGGREGALAEAASPRTDAPLARTDVPTGSGRPPVPTPRKSLQARESGPRESYPSAGFGANVPPVPGAQGPVAAPRLGVEATVVPETDTPPKAHLQSVAGSGIPSSVKRRDNESTGGGSRGSHDGKPPSLVFSEDIKLVVDKRQNDLYVDLSGTEEMEIRELRARQEEIIPSMDAMRNAAEQGAVWAKMDPFGNHLDPELTGSIVFRGDSRSPDLIFNTGFNKRNENQVFIKRRNSVVTEAWGGVSTSSIVDIATGYTYGGYVYTIELNTGGKRMPTTYRDESSLHEVMSLQVPPQDILFAIGPFPREYGSKADALRLNPGATASEEVANRGFQAAKYYLSDNGRDLESRLPFVERYRLRQDNLNHESQSLIPDAQQPYPWSSNWHQDLFTPRIVKSPASGKPAGPSAPTAQQESGGAAMPGKHRPPVPPRPDHHLRQPPTVPAREWRVAARDERAAQSDKPAGPSAPTAQQESGGAAMPGKHRPPVPPRPDHHLRQPPTVPARERRVAARDERAAQSDAVVAPLVERRPGPAAGSRLQERASAGLRKIPASDAPEMPPPTPGTLAQDGSQAKEAQPKRFFNPPKDLGNGRKGYPLSPPKSVPVGRIGTLGTDGKPRPKDQAQEDIEKHPQPSVPDDRVSKGGAKGATERDDDHSQEKTANPDLLDLAPGIRIP